MAPMFRHYKWRVVANILVSRRLVTVIITVIDPTIHAVLQINSASLDAEQPHNWEYMC